MLVGIKSFKNNVMVKKHNTSAGIAEKSINGNSAGGGGSRMLGKMSSFKRK